MFRTNSNATIWFCSIYIVSGMALTAMCFNVVHDEIVHRLRHHQEKMMPKMSSNSFTDEVNVSDPYNMTSWQFNVKNSSNFYHRNLTEETLVSTGTPTSADMGLENMNVASKMPPEVLEGVVLTGVYTLPEEPENEENSEMWTVDVFEDCAVWESHFIFTKFDWDDGGGSWRDCSISVDGAWYVVSYSTFVMCPKNSRTIKIVQNLSILKVVDCCRELQTLRPDSNQTSQRSFSVKYSILNIFQPSCWKIGLFSILL